jgi:chromosomal replication initiation ATPase DnaA
VAAVLTSPAQPIVLATRAAEQASTGLQDGPGWPQAASAADDTGARDNDRPREFLSLWRGLTKARRQPTHTAADIIAEVASRYGVPIEAMKLRIQARKGITSPEQLARDEAMWRLRQERAWREGQRWRWSFPQIAAFMGLSHHTSAMIAIRRHEARLRLL